MLKLKLQYLGHLMQRADSLEEKKKRERKRENKAINCYEENGTKWPVTAPLGRRKPLQGGDI